MPRQRSSMRKIREVLRQKWALGLSLRRIARSVGLSRPSVSNYLRRAGLRSSVPSMRSWLNVSMSYVPYLA